MSATHEGGSGPQPAAVAPPASPETATPNQYAVHGDGISVQYFPEGIAFGPETGAGLLFFTYQDAHRSLSFHDGQVRTVEVPDLGIVVSVTLVETVDTGATTFSLLLPHVVLPPQLGTAAFIQTAGITTVHRAFVAMLGHAQREGYTVTRLCGTASRSLRPL